MGLIAGIIVALGIIGAFAGGMYAMHRISEYYGAKIREAYRAQRHPHERDPFLTDAEFEAMKAGNRVRKRVS